MDRQKVNCPRCGLEVFLSERVCPFCNTMLVQPSHMTQRTAATNDVPDIRDRVLALPLWVVFAVVIFSGALDGMVVAAAVRAVKGGPLGEYEMVSQLGFYAVPIMMVGNLVKWLFDTLIVWIGVKITGSIAGEPFRVDFLEGYRNMLPITMLLVATNSIALILSLVTGFWYLIVIAWIANLFILRYFLEMDWYEVFLLNVVLGFLSCVTGGLL